MHKPGRLTTFGILLRLLLLSIAISAQFSIKAQFWEQYYPETVIVNYSDLLLQSVPEQVKSMSAGLMRLTADEYMHIGPYRKTRQNFIAGSFAGNTEIMTLLRLALYLEPTHIDTYTIMSQNLAMYLDRFDDGIRLLQQGILANRTSPELHKLYAAAAYCYGFAESYTADTSKPIKNDREVALNYIEAAIAAYNAGDGQTGSDTYDVFANIDSYRLLKSRFLLDIGKKYDALAAWYDVPHEHRSGLLATYFSLMERGIEVPESPEKLYEMIIGGQLNENEDSPPYFLPDGWYQSLFIDPEDNLKEISSRLNRVSSSRIEAFDPFATAKAGLQEPAGSAPVESHAESGHTCDHSEHDGHDCPHHQKAPGIVTIANEAGSAIFQALLMVAFGIMIRRFSTR